MKYLLKTSEKSARKYPNVIWFPRSKTDPREIREVLKIALLAQEENPEQFFSDKTLGQKMAQIGSINVLGLGGEEYIEKYAGETIGNISYITNARMLMRLFRFLGLVRRKSLGKYEITELGKLYASFSGDFPSMKDGVSEEITLLNSLSDFAFYSVNDDARYRDGKFKIRPFFWLLLNLQLEPQCIYQLIVTAFASQSEGREELARIKLILKGLKEGATNLKKEWIKVGLDPDDYSCVHNFYDSVKILVYLGTSLGLIEKETNPGYGRKISGNARHLKQANIFYKLTEKGKLFIADNYKRRPIFYEDIYSVFDDSSVIAAVFLLGTLNFRIGSIKVKTVSSELYGSLDLSRVISTYRERLGIDIIEKNSQVVLASPISFSFFHSLPPEIFHTEEFQVLYKTFMENLYNDELISLEKLDHSPTLQTDSYTDAFELDVTRRYNPKATYEAMESALQYSGKDNTFGGSDRFSSRVSPTNSIILDQGKLLVDNSRDAMDLLMPLRLEDDSLKVFIEENTIDLVNTFLLRSDIWEKDQHYTWVRNCFRHLGMEAIYSGSGGMLSRADVTVLSPFLGGIEAKSPREGRGTLNLKAIRQAVDAKIQVSDGNQNENDLKKAAIAIGRRVSNLAIQEERKWSREGQPVFLITDAVLHYLILKSATTNLSEESLIAFFSENTGLVSMDMVMALLEKNMTDKKYLDKAREELTHLRSHFSIEE